MNLYTIVQCLHLSILVVESQLTCNQEDIVLFLAHHHIPCTWRRWWIVVDVHFRLSLDVMLRPQALLEGAKCFRSSLSAPLNFKIGRVGVCDCATKISEMARLFQGITIDKHLMALKRFIRRRLVEEFCFGDIDLERKQSLL